MGIFDALKKGRKTEFHEEPIPDSEKKYYQRDEYYTNTKRLPAVGLDGNYAETKVITFEERKAISYPSKNGLYVAEILLLEYCSYGTYPHPKNGYPGFWWFKYGIRNIGAALSSLEKRGYIEYCSAIEQLPRMTIAQLKDVAAQFGIKVSGKKADIISSVSTIPNDFLENAIMERKYKLTEKGKAELQENAYIPYMHKNVNATTETDMFGAQFNVWTVNQRVGKGEKWEDIISDTTSRKKKEIYDIPMNIELAENDPEYAQLLNKLKKQKEQIELIFAAEDQYERDGNIEDLILFWENLWLNGGLLFNGSKWTFRLPDIYIKQKKYDDALRILNKIDNPAYQEKRMAYIEKIKRLTK